MKYAREYYIFFKSFIIFVIYHYIKITPNLQLKTTFMISQFHWVKNLSTP